MTVSTEKNVIPGENLSSEDGRKIHADDIAGAGKPGSKEVIEVDSKAVDDNTDDLPPLFDDEAEKDFRTRWREIQVSFVDQPRSSVEQADQLVAQLMQRLAQSFSVQRGNLEKQWEASDKISTEDLRIALQRYRSFFERLLSI